LNLHFDEANFAPEACPPGTQRSHRSDAAMEVRSYAGLDLKHAQRLFGQEVGVSPHPASMGNPDPLGLVSGYRFRARPRPISGLQQDRRLTMPTSATADVQ